MLATLKKWARRLKSEIVTLWFAYRHPQTPGLAKLVAVLVVAYAFSPIDLIPDFIPVLGWLDELILLPAGIWLALRLLPPVLYAECRSAAEAWLARRLPKPRNYVTAAIFVALWILGLWLLWRWITAETVPA
jgi:uncharacterized membrane protein YkvA (DUF1232 family)